MVAKGQGSTTEVTYFRLKPLILPVDVTSLHAMATIILIECTSEDHLLAIALFLTSWQTVAQYLGLTENDMKILNKKEK